MKLLINAFTKYICGLVAVGALIFLPAGTIGYAKGWLLICLLFGPMLIAGFVMFFKTPEFLSRRLEVKEKQATQKGVIGLSALMFVGGFILAGLDYRLGWSEMPAAVTVVSSVLFLVAYALYAEVMRENAYLSRTVKVEEGQTVVNTGLYGIVRHPMYMTTILLFLMIPVILGSWFALLVFALYPVIIVVRIKDEEKLLAKELPGYTEYMETVKYRILPFIW